MLIISLITFTLTLKIGKLYEIGIFFVLLTFEMGKWLTNFCRAVFFKSKLRKPDFKMDFSNYFADFINFYSTTQSTHDICPVGTWLKLNEFSSLPEKRTLSLSLFSNTYVGQ